MRKPQEASRVPPQGIDVLEFYLCGTTGQGTTPIRYDQNQERHQCTKCDRDCHIMEYLRSALGCARPINNQMFQECPCLSLSRDTRGKRKNSCYYSALYMKLDLTSIVHTKVVLGTRMSASPRSITINVFLRVMQPLNKPKGTS